MSDGRIFEGIVVVDEMRGGAALGNFHTETFVRIEDRDGEAFVVDDTGVPYRIENSGALIPHLRSGAVGVVCVTHYDPVTRLVVREYPVDLPEYEAAPTPGRR